MVAQKLQIFTEPLGLAGSRPTKLFVLLRDKNIHILINLMRQIGTPPHYYVK
jgi:hypothetical protein